MHQAIFSCYIPLDEQVTLTTTYLSRDAKLWQNTRTNNDVESWRPRINMWETLKKELKDHYLIFNIVWVAWESLKGSNGWDLLEIMSRSLGH